MSHWCKDIERDEAVRASEDGRSGPLPTLEEAIAAVTERRPPEPRGGGNVTGVRTERVTLEITRPVFANYPTSAVHFQWQHLLRDVVKGDRESVRVVDTHHQAVAESVAWEGARDAYRGRIARLTDERDAAIRERDTLRAERITQALTADRFAAAVQEADTLRARVAELEEQLESVADRAAAAETALQSSGQADEEDANIGYALRLFVDGSRVLSHELDRQQAGAFLIAAEHLAKYLRTEYQPPVEESAPAASGAAGTGWLTADERLAVSGAILILDQQGATNIGRALDSLLNRSSPPEVVLEGFTPDAVRNLDTKYLAGWDQCMALAKRAILAAGVKVKEVGRE